MGLGKVVGYILGALALVVIAIVVFFGGNDEVMTVNQSSSQRGVQEAQRRADDPTYAQEIRGLTAKLKAAEDQMKIRENRYEEEISNLETQISEMNYQLSTSQNSEQLEQIQATLEQLNEQKTAAEQESQTLKKEFEKISEQLAQVQNAKSEEIEALRTELATVTEQAKSEVKSTVDAIRAQLLAEQQNTVEEQNANDLLGIDDITVATTTPASRTVNHRPYQVPGLETPASAGNTGSAQGNDLASLLPFEQLDRASDELSSAITGAPLRGTNVTTTTGGRQEQALTVFPVYTLPPTTMLTDSKLLTPLVGRVPIAGNLNDPFKFQLELSRENLAANQHKIPGVAKAIASGIAIGNREQSCVRGVINSMTFIFEDGTIHNVGTPRGGNNVRNGLGYLADNNGTPCVLGQYINNAGSYLKDRSLAAFLEGLAAAYGQTQVEVINDEGSLTSFVSGNAFEFAAAQGVSNSAAEIADYVRQRALDAFDVVYVPQAHKVQIILEQQIEIDYDVNARKTSYVNENRGVTYD